MKKVVESPSPFTTGEVAAVVAVVAAPPSEGDRLPSAGASHRAPGSLWKTGGCDRKDNGSLVDSPP